MNIIEKSIIYATVMQEGMTRKISNMPYIMHSLEVAQIISTITDDQEVIAAGVLHDIVEDTCGTLDQIEKRFGQRIASLVASETENSYAELDRAVSWRRRKEESLKVLRNSADIGVKILWLADKLSNIRSLRATYYSQGDKVWEHLHQKDPAVQLWYYREIALACQDSLKQTSAFNEYVQHLNTLWPGSFKIDG